LRTSGLLGCPESLREFEGKAFAKSTSNQFQAIDARRCAAFARPAPFRLNRRGEPEFD
jgi:hypothetical protein